MQNTDKFINDKILQAYSTAIDLNFAPHQFLVILPFITTERQSICTKGNWYLRNYWIMFLKMNSVVVSNAIKEIATSNVLLVGVNL